MIKLFEQEQSILYDAEEITGSTYEMTEDGFVIPANLLSCIEELVNEYKELERKFIEFNKEVQDNFKPISKESQNG